MKIKLSEIETLLKSEDLLKEFITEDKWFYKLPVADREISALSYNSKVIDKDTLFFCKGLNFKAAYLEMAVEEGLRYYISENPYEVPAALGIIVTDIRKAMAVISMHFYGLPQDQLTLIGFTGTKGKTTTAYFTRFILDAYTDKKVALFSTMNTTLDGKTYFKSALTTPESMDLYRMMREAVDNGMTHLVMEVSSQAYKLERVYGLTFDVGIFLNISPDHISPIEHPTFDDYYYCKRRLIENSKQMVLNTGTKDFALLKEMVESRNIPYYTYGGETDLADYTWQKTGNGLLGFEVLSSKDTLEINGNYTIKLMGDFNKENALASLITSSLVGANKEAMVSGLANTLVPGRMEYLEHPNGANIIVDYAHNYLSLKNLLTFAKSIHPEGRVITVIGSTGDKATSRRADFGKVLSKLTDIAILTADDPASEDPVLIAQEIAAAIDNPQVEQMIIVDREEAINYALEMADSKDSVILAGKGQDQYQKIQGVNVPYKGDAIIAENYIKNFSQSN